LLLLTLSIICKPLSIKCGKAGPIPPLPPPPSDQMVWGNVISGVQLTVPAKNKLNAFYLSQNPSGGKTPIGLSTLLTKILAK